MNKKSEIKPETKAQIINNLLNREEGVTLAELIEATSWQSHSVRGHISNIKRKNKANIETFATKDGKHGYRIAQEAKAA